MAEREVPSVHRAVVDRLIGDLRPVRPLPRPAIRLAAWLPLQLLLLGWVVGFHLRGDALAALERPLFLVQVLSLSIAGALAASLALRAAVPGDEPSARQATGAGALALAALLVSLVEPGHAEPSLAAFVGRGAPCAALTTALAALPWLLLLLAVARGVPLAGARAGAWAGVAAFLLACALMRLACPLDDRLHLLVWHGGPVLPALLVSAGLGWLWLAPRHARRSSRRSG